MGTHILSPLCKPVLAEGMAVSGEIEAAAGLVDAMLDQVERPGWQERLHYPEVMRIRGWIRTLKGDAQGAERSYRTALDWACKHQAKSWELRMATSLGRLWRSQGRQGEAHALLAPIHAWFTEGFDTKDLKDARALLDELS